MELRQLEYFLAVAEELHFGRAAKRSFVEQPALSRSIKRLEEELGARLLDRTSRSVQLTEEGHFFYDETKELLTRLSRAAKRVRNMATGTEGSLSILFIAPMSQTRFPEVLRAFQAQYPGVYLEMQELPSKKQIEAVREGYADIGFIRSHSDELDDLSSMIFCQEPYMLAVSELHPLANAGDVTLQMLDGVDFVGFSRSAQPRLYDDLHQAFEEANSHPRNVHEAASKQSALGLVAAGMGVALMPQSMMRLTRDGVVYRPLVESGLPKVEFRVIWRDDDNPRVQPFLETLQDVEAMK